MKVRTFLWLAATGLAVFGLEAVRHRNAVNRMRAFYEGKVAIITGASASMGAGYALELAAYGAIPVLAARRADQLEQVAHDCEAVGGFAVVIPTDVIREEDLRRLVDETMARFGRVDILINNAGVLLPDLLAEARMSDIEMTLKVNLEAVIKLTRLVVPHMLLQRSGLIINVASMSVESPTPFLSVYQASKAALLVFDRTLRREVHGHNIHVMSFQPGWTATEMTSGQIAAGAPYGMTPQDVAAATHEALLCAVMGKRRVQLGAIEKLNGLMDWLLPDAMDWLWGNLLMERLRPFLTGRPD